MVKTITRQQMIGMQGETFVSERASSMGFMFSRYGPLEAGIDGLLEIRDHATGAATGQLVAVQVKTRETGSFTAESETSFEYLMDEDDVTYWRCCNLPVVVVLVHLERRQAYWQSVDSGTGVTARRLVLDKTKDVFDTRARDAIAGLCVEKGGLGVWFPPLKTVENGHLNLLEVDLPDTIFAATSPFKSGSQALHELLDLGYDGRIPGDWIIRSGQFMSFRDPRNTPLNEIVDIETVEEIDACTIAYPDDEAEEYRVIELLRRTMLEQFYSELTFNRKQNAVYFRAVPETIEQVYSYTSLKQSTSADVVKKYEQNGKLKYVRHHAFEPRFWRIDDRWFLSVMPTFVFTWDGFRPDKFAAGRLAGKKQREYNSALVGQFAMWRYVLTGNDEGSDNNTLFATEPKREWILNFRSLAPLSLPRGVPDDLWRATEPETDTNQLRLAI